MRGDREGKVGPRRRVYLSDVRKGKPVEVQALKAWRQAQLRARGRIVAKSDERLNRHGPRRAHCRGRTKVTVQMLTNGITVNAKRMMKPLVRAETVPAALEARACLSERPPPGRRSGGESNHAVGILAACTRSLACHRGHDGGPSSRHDRAARWGDRAAEPAAGRGFPPGRLTAPPESSRLKS